MPPTPSAPLDLDAAAKVTVESLIKIYRPQLENWNNEDLFARTSAAEKAEITKDLRKAIHCSRNEEVETYVRKSNEGFILQVMRHQRQSAKSAYFIVSGATGKIDAVVDTSARPTKLTVGAGHTETIPFPKALTLKGISLEELKDYGISIDAERSIISLHKGEYDDFWAQDEIKRIAITRDSKTNFVSIDFTALNKNQSEVHTVVTVAPDGEHAVSNFTRDPV